MQDTSADAQRRYFELLRRQTPTEKLRAVVQLNASVRRLAMAGIRQSHPDASPEEQKRLLAARLYGELGSAAFR